MSKKDASCSGTVMRRRPILAAQGITLLTKIESHSQHTARSLQPRPKERRAFGEERQGLAPPSFVSTSPLHRPPFSALSEIELPSARRPGCALFPASRPVVPPPCRAPSPLQQISIANAVACAVRTDAPNRVRRPRPCRPQNSQTSGRKSSDPHQQSQKITINIHTTSKCFYLLLNAHCLCSKIGLEWSNSHKYRRKHRSATSCVAFYDHKTPNGTIR